MLIRFGAGFAGSVLLGLAVFGGAVFRPAYPAFECVPLGALVAATLALVRTSFRGQAIVLMFGFGGLNLALTADPAWSTVASGILLVPGLFGVALIYDLLSRSGMRFGKFLLVGPLVGGVFLALAPITELDSMNVSNAASVITLRFALGVVIGEGATLGVELAEMFTVEAAGE